MDAVEKAGWTIGIAAAFLLGWSLLNHEDACCNDCEKSGGKCGTGK